MTFTVDTHHHILPDFFFQATNEADHPVGGIAPPPWSRAGALSFLDDAASTSPSPRSAPPACTPATTPRPVHWRDGATS